MIDAGNPQQSRLLTALELAACIRLFREGRQWSQEQLAEISGLSVRTVQRVERGLSASLDTRRALASAFGFEDIDALNKPFAIPSAEEMQEAQEKFDRENVTLTALPLSTGRKLAKLAEICEADLSELAFEPSRDTDEAFVALLEYFRDYRDCASFYEESQKFEAFDELQARIDALHLLGVSLRYAERKTLVRWGSHEDAKPMPVNILYLVGFLVGEAPEKFATPKAGNFHL
ncbi:helix-turn-helix transcriptional regulator [Burkholderia gladioli]|uniref:helix-turn-helix domain-containing protein n=1 Tax=Burkholderia gladioli TaxID=28095 RepID=UPI00264F1F56|nr:helix-turn-helix transcriptional regulator [Burkholderia gladioli]MDN7599780.1 helix-turn-helix transcriptional regulator [Burkholderia gladioli]